MSVKELLLNFNKGEQLKSELNYLKREFNPEKNIFDKFLEQFLNAWLLENKHEKQIRNILKELVKSGLGARVCYSPDDILTILTKDERLITYSNLKNYLNKLLKIKHLSIFRHSIFTLTKEEFTHILAQNVEKLIMDLDIKIEDIIKLVKYLSQSERKNENNSNNRFNKFDYNIILDLYRDYEYIKTEFPVYKTTTSIEDLRKNIELNTFGLRDFYFELTKLILQSLYYTPYIEKNSIALNLQHLIELKNEKVDIENIFTNLKTLPENVKEALYKEEISTLIYDEIDVNIDNTNVEILIDDEVKTIPNPKSLIVLNSNLEDVLKNNEALSEYIKDLIFSIKEIESDNTNNNAENNKINIKPLVKAIIENLIREQGIYISVVYENVSRNLTHQLVRHSLYASYSQRSLRYVNESKSIDKLHLEDEAKELNIPVEILTINKKFVYPDLSYLDNKKKKGRQPKISNKVKAYTEIFETYKLTFDEYNELIENYEVKKEDSRYVLPNGVKTTIVATFYGRALENLLVERVFNPKAQKEIRNLSKFIWKYILDKIFKTLELE
jgi:flavin-dependent thymidylate synthase